ncbi:MAG: hypothetical protein WA900_12990, partial [Casimicrobiaceae bacterium]
MPPLSDNARPLSHVRLRTVAVPTCYRIQRGRAAAQQQPHCPKIGHIARRVWLPAQEPSATGIRAQPWTRPMHEHSRLALESRIAAAREKFFGQRGAPYGLLSSPILRSWDRCRAAGIDERYPLAFDPVGRARLAECRERHEELRRLSEPAAAR